MSHLVSYSRSLEFLGMGSLGVEVFFVISGFIMVFITREREQQPIEFMMSRIARVVPLYWLLTIALFGLALVAPQLLESTRADLAALLKSLFFIPFVKHGNVVQPLLFQGWTLNFEMMFYALFAASLIVERQRNRVIVLGFVLCLPALAGAVLAPLGPVAGFYASPVLLCFAVGMGLGLVYPRIGPGLAGLAVVLFVITVVLVMARGEPPLHSSFVRNSFAFAAATVALTGESPYPGSRCCCSAQRAIRST